jgi:hypothetical protein
VLLALNFFEKDRSLRITPLVSFKARHTASTKELESDLGLMWQETAFGETQDGMLFAECKSYNKFERKDFDRIRMLSEQFPGAILAFCTLRKDLDPREKKRFEGSQNWERSDGKPIGRSIPYLF